MAVPADAQSSADPVSPEQLKELIAKAERGDAAAQIFVGQLYQVGNGVPVDPERSVEYYRKAAAAGSADGMAQLGSAYMEGIGVARDPEEAARWLRKGADGGDSRAMTNLGAAYARGMGVPPDIEAAFAWYTKAANAGDGLGMANLAHLYRTGHGVVRDASLAFKWYQRAADLDEPTGLHGLAGFYIMGEVVETDMEKGMALLRKSGILGNVEAAIVLARMHRYAGTTESDQVEALMWFIVAIDRRSPSDERIEFDLEGGRDELNARLTEQQRKLAEERAAAILYKLRGSIKGG